MKWITYIVNDILPVLTNKDNTKCCTRNHINKVPVIAATINAGLAGKNVRYASEVG